jgi:hypothetical protein
MGKGSWRERRAGRRRAGAVVAVTTLVLVAAAGTAVCMADALHRLGPALRAGNGRDCCPCRGHPHLDASAPHSRF